MEAINEKELNRDFYELARLELTRDYEKHLAIINKCVRQLEDTKSEVTDEYEEAVKALKVKYGQ